MPIARRRKFFCIPTISGRQTSDAAGLTGQFANKNSVSAYLLRCQRCSLPQQPAIGELVTVRSYTHASNSHMEDVKNTLIAYIRR